MSSQNSEFEDHSMLAWFRNRMDKNCTFLICTRTNINLRKGLAWEKLYISLARPIMLVWPARPTSHLEGGMFLDNKS